MREVSLGLPGAWADDNLEAADHYTTKIGGVADWPFPESLLEPELLECVSCKSKLCLILQVYAPIYDSAVRKIEERVLYVCGCSNPPCESWRAIRVQKPELVDFEAAPSVVSPSASDFKPSDVLCSVEDKLEDDGDEDDDDDDLDMEELGRALFEAANVASKPVKGVKKNNETNVKAHSLHPTTRKVDPNVPVLPCFYVYNQEDRSSQDPVAVCSSYAALSSKEAQVYKDNNEPTQEESWEEEGYEYDKALNADRTFLKFKKKLDKCPEQCFRYSFGGRPLLVTGDVGDPRPCNLCGEPRHYEMQLMSPLVYFLQEGAIGGQKNLLENWDWMTLLVYTCSKSCFQKVDHDVPKWHGWTVVEETVIAQFEKPVTESSRLGYFC